MPYRVKVTSPGHTCFWPGGNAEPHQFASKADAEACVERLNWIANNLSVLTGRERAIEAELDWVRGERRHAGNGRR